MSLVLRQAGSLKPEIRLAQAVSEFEAILNPEQKSSFQASRARAVSTPPTMSDVMRLTAEIDLMVTSKHGRGRCFGPRMTNTLQAIQQFAALGDIIVGGGQNLIACAVWATARMTLHVITGHFVYLENLSLLLMDIGRNAPRYQTMASFYPKSKVLQRYLCEYFVVITNLCHESVTWTRKHALSRLSSTISDPQMKTYKDDLDIWSSAIKEEVNALLNHTVVEEAKRNSLFRSFATSRSYTSAHQRKIERQTRFMDACSRYDYRSTWKQKRKCGTTRLTTTCYQYEQWKAASEGTSILFLGKLGAGKSVLLANVVDDLSLQNNATTLYFFSRHDSEESMKARTIFGCLIRQLLEHLMDNTEFGHLFPMTVPQLDLDDIVDLFRLARPKGTSVFIVVDGLDECETGVQRTVLQHLADIRAFGYKVCLSLRTSELGPIWDTHSCCHRVFISEENPDISDFVNTEVDSRFRDRRLVTHDPCLVEEIKHKLIAGACGMFLWASLQLDSICAEVSDQDIREAIQNLPRDLTETFKRNLAKSSLRDYKRYHVRLFKLLVSAKELLTTEQLRRAASVTIGQAVWNPTKEINTIDPILSFCGSLVMVDEEEETVRFIHHSARNFCIRGPHHIADWTFSELEADQHMSEILVTYMSYTLFETKVSRSGQLSIDVKGMPKEVARNALSSVNIGRNIAEKIISSTSQMKRDIGPTLAVGINPSREDDRFPLLDYAKRHWLQHTAHLEDLPLLPQWYNLLKRSTIGIDHHCLPIELIDTFPSLSQLIGAWSVPSSPQAMVRTESHMYRPPQFLAMFTLAPMLRRRSFKIQSVCSQYRNIYWAVSNGHILILKYELTSPRGSRRIKRYVMLWSLLRYIALTKPSIIQHELSYDLVRWLSPMFCNLAMDHPAKQYFLERIPAADRCYMTFVKVAVKHIDLVAIRALIRNDYEYQSDLSLFECHFDDRSIDVPPILKGSIPRPFEGSTVQDMIQNNDHWLFDLATWVSRVDSTSFQRHTKQDEFLSFQGFFKSLRRAGVPSRELRLLRSIRRNSRDQLKGGFLATIPEE